MKRSQRDKVKTGKHTGHTDPNENSTNQNACKWNGKTVVSGEVSIKVPPDVKSQYQTAQDENSSHNKRTRLIGWLTLIAVIVYAGLTAWQAFESRRANINAIETRSLQLRAWVTLTTIQLENGPLVPGVPNHIKMVMKNTGASPALHVHMHSDPEFPKECDPRPVRSPFHSEMPLGPGDITENPNNVITLSQSCVESLESGSGEFKIIGVVEYDDIFGRHHHTWFCSQYEATTTKLLTACGAGNEMD